ncbi:mcm2 3 5 family protein [Stylonychia lemnae]|uniref:DNA helicase n=1 Tax=Stylonychia lemnae TaxID=5949 RepID=A0A078ALU9_STYLE|nr:mcm2 3 5 family protein [Stylonychia lemnae]|eukprot:CDW81828.1 mcm2 3 5 family protein [Stylonychia lemnae]
MIESVAIRNELRDIYVKQWNTLMIWLKAFKRLGGDDQVIERRRGVDENEGAYGQDLYIFRRFLYPKKHVDVRLINVPPLREIFLDTIRNLRQFHVNKFMVIQGTVIRTNLVKNRETKKDFACKSCGKIYRASSDIYEFTNFLLPPICGGEVEKKPNPFFNMLMTIRRRNMAQGNQNANAMFQGVSIGQCNGKNFVPIHGTAQYKDYQEIKIQEVYKTLKPGVIPRSTIIILEDELVDRAKPGDDVMISGIFIQRWRSPFNRTERPQIEIAFLANNVIQLNKRDFKKEINKQVYNDIQKFWKTYERKNPEKLGILLSVIGGVQKQNENDPRIRGQIHMLMVGEPGTGKSQLLTFASKISMRSVVTTGIGTTSAGLTVALFKDGNEYILEAGALVLADFGVCCIDEFSLIRHEDRGSIHEAMEQQTISIAKGGITCKINSRATIIAATNPSKTQKWNNRYDNNQNTGIATSLLSRFDMVFILVDMCILEQDLAQANFKLALTRQDEEEEVNQKIWNIEKLTKYIVYVQRYIDPVCSDKAEMIIQAYFQYLRNCPTLGKDRKTVRMLESLIRMAEAHARLMNKNDIDIYDAICVIILQEHCINTGLYIELPQIIMSRQTYEKAKYETLMKLGLKDYKYFDDDFDQILTEVPHQRPNNMGDETAFMMETYYNLDRTEHTHHDRNSNQSQIQDLKAERNDDCEDENDDTIMMYSQVSQSANNMRKQLQMQQSRNQSMQNSQQSISKNIPPTQDQIMCIEDDEDTDQSDDGSQSQKIQSQSQSLKNKFGSLFGNTTAKQKENLDFNFQKKNSDQRNNQKIIQSQTQTEIDGQDSLSNGSGGCTDDQSQYSEYPNNNEISINIDYARVGNNNVNDETDYDD